MLTCSRTATTLDAKMLAGLIVPDWISDEKLREISGQDVANEIGGRCLLRYLRPEQMGSFFAGTSRKQYVTPTAYTPDEASRWLALVFPWILRRHVLLIDPKKIDRPVRGPRAIAGGFGIEYVLPEGFSAEAIANPGFDLEVT
ncbi:hypothetical protein [Streptomyces sp. P3]|uniref:hypothetical protein n=1 Tax=Streptomyces sp. P3 TaxID=2135430 RepID=UPI00131EED6B|nr:hypothetical protein [Streptomyces sp. P3]